MTRDVLFLLPPGFSANGRREFCPECAEIWGVLSYYPAIKESLDIRYQPIDRPRLELTGLLGDDHQNCPTLLLGDNSDAGDTPVQTANGARFIDNARDIAKYFAHRYGTAFPRGS
ncbi:DUF3088 family protein [Hyphococcus sp. DH-69]|uniref:DUF3088 family protein n=1 Tax=Hyphococcus formosus TaxID=3143534 RepID=UPI00398A5222